MDLTTLYALALTFPDNINVELERFVPHNTIGGSIPDDVFPALKK